MEIKGNFINFNNDDNLRAKKTPEPSPAMKKEEAKTENKAPVDPKYWQQRTGISFGSKEKLESGEDDFCKLLEDLCKENPMDSSFVYNLKNESAKKLYELIKTGKLTPEVLSSMSNKLYLFTFQDKDNMQDFISTVYEACMETEKGEENQNFIVNLISPYLFISKIKPEHLQREIKEAGPLSKKAAEFFAQIGEKYKFAPFKDTEIYDATLKMLDGSNFESYKSSFEKRCETKNPYDVSYIMQTFINPTTDKYDPEIDEATKKFYKKKNEPEHKYNGFLYSEIDAAKIVKAMVDGQTGKISEKAVQFTNDYYFGEKEETKETMLQSFISHFKSSVITAPPYYKNSYNFHDNYAEILEALKDKTGAFNDTNIKYMSKLLESKHGWFSTYDRISFFKFLKDENGVVKRSSFSFAQKVLEKTNDMEKTGEIVEIWATYGKENFGKTLKKLKKLYGNYERYAYDNIAAIIRNCFKKDGTPIEENLKLVDEITKISSNYMHYNDDVFRAFKNPYCKELLKKIQERPTYSASDITGIVNINTNYSDENGEIPSFVKEKIDEFLKTDIDLSLFGKLYDNCFYVDENGKKQFDEKLYQNCLNLISYSPSGDKTLGKKLFSFLDAKDFVALTNQTLSASSLKFKTKVDLYEALRKVNFDLETNSNPISSYLKSLTYEIDTNLSGEVNSLPVNQEYIDNFIHTIFSKCADNELSSFETTLKNAIPKLKEMEEGLPLRYSRQSFLSDLSKLIKNEEQIKIIENKTDINLKCAFDGKKANIEGYEGILTLDKLDRSNEFENEVYNLCHKFMYENSIMTGDKNLDEELNTIIKAAPEFINCIGKQQHGTHKYTLDIHQLLVLANSINNPNYNKLNSLDKAMLKITAIFHDIAKEEGVVDKGHQEPSALYARGIIKKFIKNPETAERVYELTKNHHWLEEYSSSNASDEAARQMAFKFRRPNDFEIAKIMAKADLMAVSDEFYEARKQALDEDKMFEIENNLKKFYATGNAVFAEKIIRPSLLEKNKESFMGEEYKVINFHKIGNDESLANYGFRDIKKKDAKFLVHMLPEYEVEKHIETVKQLTSSINGGVLSESLITPLYKRTYCDRKFGVLLSQINPNVINMADKNQGSGTAKDIQSAIDLVFSTHSDDRNNFKNSLLKNLSIDPKTVSDEDYAEFYKNNIAQKSSVSNFSYNKIYKLGNHSITGKQLMEAIEKFQDSLIDKEEKRHNEIVGYVPKIEGVIAKANGLDEVPKELLDFAKKNNYPIILI